MAGEVPITVIGNLVESPEIRFTPAGQAVANVNIASNPRKFDRQKNEWVDGDPLFLRGSIWRDAAEHVIESLSKGDRVIASGTLVQRSYEDRDGNPRTVIEMQIEEIGPSLRFKSARVVEPGEQMRQVRQTTAPAAAPQDGPPPF